jgi:hypothetical protein
MEEWPVVQAIMLLNGIIVCSTSEPSLKCLDSKNDYNCTKTVPFNHAVDKMFLLTNGNLLITTVSYGRTNSMQIYSYYDDFRSIKSFDLEEYYIHAFANLSDNKYSIGNSSKIEIYNINNGYEPIKKFQAHKLKYVYGLIYKNKDLLISGSSGKTIKFWDINKDYQCTGAISTLDSGVSSLCLLPCGYFASGFYNGKIRIWDMSNLKCVNTIEGDYYGKYFMVLLKDRRIIVNYFNAILILDY